jgi:hypothetical protein
MVDHEHGPGSVGGREALLVDLDRVSLGVFSWMLDVVLVKPGDGIDVVHTTERTCRGLEVGVELLDEGSGDWVGEEGIDGVADNVLDVGHKVVEVYKRELGLKMGVLAKMTTGMTVLRAETLLNAEDVAQGRETGLQVQLGALSEERWLAIVVELEEGGAAFDLGLDEAGRGDFDEVVVGQCLAEGGQHVGAETEDARGVLSTENEMAEVGLNGRI